MQEPASTTTSAPVASMAPALAPAPTVRLEPDSVKDAKLWLARGDHEADAAGDNGITLVTMMMTGSDKW